MSRSKDVIIVRSASTNNVELAFPTEYAKMLSSIYGYPQSPRPSGCDVVTEHASQPPATSSDLNRDRR